MRHGKQQRSHHAVLLCNPRMTQVWGGVGRCGASVASRQACKLMHGDQHTSLPTAPRCTTSNVRRVAKGAEITRATPLP